MPILTPEERVGTTVAGKYRLDRILAVGGMGTVFAGQHEWTHRDVAVKILNYEHARKPEIVRRFLQEARAASQLRHPNVVDVLDMGEAADGSVYMVLELLHGKTLKARMRQGDLGFEELITHMVPVMDALTAAHDKGVVHRDLKPDNIFLAEAHGKTVPKLLDFGIAKVLGGDSSATGTGVMIGTPQYMAPEQVRGDKSVGPAADVWSLGVVLFGALSGRLPFRGDSSAATIAKVLVEEAPKLRQVAPKVPEPIADVVDRALSRDPSARWPSVEAMKTALLAAKERASHEFELQGQTDSVPVVPTVQLDVSDLSPAPGTPAPDAEEISGESSGIEEPVRAAAADTDDDKTIHTPTPAPSLHAATTAPVPAVVDTAPNPASPPSMPPSASAPSETPYTWSTTSDVSRIEGSGLPRPVWWIGLGVVGGLVLLTTLSLAIWGISSIDDGGDVTTTGTHGAGAPPPAAPAIEDAGVLAAASEGPRPDVGEPGAPRPETPETESPETESPETESPETESPETESPETESPETSEAEPPAGEPDVGAPDEDEAEEPEPDRASTRRAGDRRAGAGDARGRGGRRRGGRRRRREPERGTGGALILR